MTYTAQPINASIDPNLYAAHAAGCTGGRLTETGRSGPIPWVYCPGCGRRLSTLGAGFRGMKGRDYVHHGRERGSDGDLHVYSDGTGRGTWR